MNKHALAVGIAIAASAASVILLILKCYGVQIEWPWVLMPVVIVAGVWFVTILVLIAAYVLNDMLEGALWR